MRFLQMLLVFSTLLTLVFSFPIDKDYENSTVLPQNRSKVLESAPLVVLVEEENPKSGSIVVEFVYRGNTIADSKINEKNKYVIDTKKNEGISSMNLNLKKHEKHKIQEIKLTENIDQNSHIQPPNTSLKIKENSGMVGLTALIPEEAFPLFGKWPKYLYDAINPVQPFPELQDKKLNQIQIRKLENPTTNMHLSPNVKDKPPQDIAGPQLNPLSIYNREFRQSIFD